MKQYILKTPHGTYYRNRETTHISHGFTTYEATKFIDKESAQSHANHLELEHWGKYEVVEIEK